jgi:putative oxidoreductase
MLAPLKSSGLLTGRVLLSAIFILSGTMKIMNWSKTAEHMESEGMIAVPFLLFMAIVFEIGGGLSVLLGCWTRLGAAALIIFLIPATLIFHDFWTFEGAAREMQMQNFLKNLTIMGGLATLIAVGAGAFSIDAWLARRRAANLAAYQDMKEAIRPAMA